MQGINARGLVVQLNFRPTEFLSSGTQVRRWSSGTARNVETGEYYMFNTRGQLLEKMGKWHVQKYRADKRFTIADEVVNTKTKNDIEMVPKDHVSKAARLRSATTRSTLQGRCTLAIVLIAHTRAALRDLWLTDKILPLDDASRCLRLVAFMSSSATR